MTLWGTGGAYREFLHVDDLAQACLFLMESYDSPELVNVGCGHDIMIRELAGLVGQIVGYSIFDLREWKRDVMAYVRAVEQVLIDALGEFGIAAGREPGATGVWTEQGKIAAIGVHISRWVTSHGFALNVDTDLSYFRYIVPCGLTKPVTSMRELGCQAGRDQIVAAVARSFAHVFDREVEKI